MKLHLEQWVLAAVLLLLGCGQEVKMVEVDPGSIRFSKRTQSQKIEAKGLDIHDAPLQGITFTFRSEDTSVATVEPNGVVKPTGNGGTAIVARTPNGTEGEAFVKVCLPKDLICDPGDKLTLKVGLAAPIKCHVTNCRDEKIPTRINLIPSDTKMVLKEGDNVFIGLAVGDTEVTVKAFDMEKKVAIRVDEQVYAPGMGPSSGGGGRRRGGGGSGKDGDPYGGGRFDHIIKNMKF